MEVLIPILIFGVFAIFLSAALGGMGIARIEEARKGKK